METGNIQNGEDSSGFVNTPPLIKVTLKYLLAKSQKRHCEEVK